MSLNEELAELKYQYEKAIRVKESLQKNYERRKKLNLIDRDEEDSIKSDLEDISIQISDLRSKVRKLESEGARSRVISESNEKSPWEN